jgi:hypothetical protein
MGAGYVIIGQIGDRSNVNNAESLSSGLSFALLRSGFSLTPIGFAIISFRLEDEVTDCF